MKTLLRLIGATLTIYLILLFLNHRGYKHSEDKDYYIVLPELPETKDTINSKLHKPKDTTPYKGKWVDVQ